jgi:hypothetical protein
MTVEEWRCRMRMVLLLIRCAFVPVALLTTLELSRTNYVVQACAHGGYCDRYANTRSALGCGATCNEAAYNANNDLVNQGFPGCLGSNGTCDVEHSYVSTDCYYDASSGQYCEELSQEYGCWFCV